MYKKYGESDREDYYEQFIFPKSILQLHQLQMDIGAEDVLKSSIPVNFQNLKFGVPKKKVLNSIGKPKFIIQKEILSNKSYEILFYKKTLDNNKLISQWHFLGDMFFCGCHTFRYLSRSQFPHIKNLLLEKYSGNPTTEVHKIRNNNIILDTYYNQIRFVDDVYLNLLYLSGEDNFKELIGEYAKEYEIKKHTNRQVSYKQLYGVL